MTQNIETHVLNNAAIRAPFSLSSLKHSIKCKYYFFHYNLVSKCAHDMSFIIFYSYNNI